MTMSRIVIAAALSASAVVPAGAADLGYYYVKKRVVAPSPYKVVNQGPVFSGPSLIVADIGITETGLTQRYPYVRSYPYIRRERAIVMHEDYYYDRAPRRMAPPLYTK